MITIQQYCQQALEIWFERLIPALFPFIFLANLFAEYIPSIRHRRILVPITILSGWLFGLPIGAKMIADLTEHHAISADRGQRLLAICNMISPAYVFGVVLPNYEIHRKTTFHMLFLFYFTPLLCSVLQEFLQFLFEYCKKMTVSVKSMKPILSTGGNSQRLRIESEGIGTLLQEACPLSVPFSKALDHAVTNALKGIGKIGGWMIISSAIAGILSLFLPRGISAACFPILEISSGLWITERSLHSVLLYVTFGGISCFMQTKSFIDHSGLSCAKYLFSKILQVIILTLLFYGKALP